MAPLVPEATRFLSWNVYYAPWTNGPQKRILRGTAHFVHCMHAEANDLLGRAGEVAEAILEVDPEIVSLQDPRQWQRQDAEKERARFKLAGAVERMG